MKDENGCENILVKKKRKKDKPYFKLHEATEEQAIVNCNGNINGAGILKLSLLS